MRHTSMQALRKVIMGEDECGVAGVPGVAGSNSGSLPAGYQAGVVIPLQALGKTSRIKS